ncbi:MAG TPA: ACT domain-containing protein [Ktedonobacterales bacterium]|nr:ACT domain-containing protein [Ktedonobacterales bacterium]
MNPIASLTLEVLAERLAVARLPPDAPIPQLPLTGPLLSLTVTADEISIVCAEDAAPEGAEVSSGWRALRVAGELDFSLIGILFSLTETLAGVGVSVFALSTYTTDYLLVRAAELDQAIAALRAAGHTIVGA